MAESHERGCKAESVETDLLPKPWRWCPGCRRHVQEEVDGIGRLM